MKSPSTAIAPSPTKPTRDLSPKSASPLAQAPHQPRSTSCTRVSGAVRGRRHTARSTNTVASAADGMGRPVVATLVGTDVTKSTTSGVASFLPSVQSVSNATVLLSASCTWISGDVVTVESAAFARPDTSLDGATAPGAFDFDKFDLLHIGEIVALLLTALALVFFVLRPLIGGLFSKPDQGDLPPDIAKLKGAKRAKAIAAMQAAAANAPQQVHHEVSENLISGGEGRVVGFDAPMPDRLDAGIDVARISGQVKASSIKKISEVVASHPDESVSIIRSWLAEEPADRAA